MSVLMSIPRLKQNQTAMFFIIFFHLLATTTLAQQGFLNILCGASKNETDPMFSSSYHTDFSKDLSWITDDSFIQCGKKGKTSGNYDLTPDTLQFTSDSVRYFPTPYNKSCYRLPISPNKPHLLRLWFVPFTIRNATFSYTIEALDMLVQSGSPITETTTRWDETTTRWDDWIVVTSGNTICVCLIRGNYGDPYVSAIQLIQLGENMYPQAKTGVALLTKSRVYIDYQSSYIRFPDDDYDRIWKGASIVDNIEETEETIFSGNTVNRPPSTVLQSAYTVFNSLNFPIRGDPEKDVLVLLYFACLWNKTELTHDLSFGISLDDYYNETVTLNRNYTAVQVTFISNRSSDEGLHSLYFNVPNSSGNDTIPPALLNAFEVYNIVQSEMMANLQEVAVLKKLKKELKLNFTSWVLDSDPCFATPWERVSCNNKSQIIGLDLSNRELQGPFPNLSSLTKLETIDLRDNKFSGALPDWLPHLENLKYLYIQNNDFSGNKSRRLYKNSTQIYSDGNKHLVIYPPNDNMSPESSPGSPPMSPGTQKWTPRDTGIAVSAVVLVFLCLLLATSFLRKKPKFSSRLQRSYSEFGLPDIIKLRSFTMKEMVSATQDFSKELGRGGFGSVYYGKLQDGGEIAVKVLSRCSQQGQKEFLNELNLLSEVNHNKLVKLLGFCKDSDELMIVYEYMAGGSLEDHIHSTKQHGYELSWKERLKIALDAAQGLEYLHMNCKPKIIYRDLKSANILLDGKLNGKLSDLGLSKVVMEEATHVSTQAKGTIGYLDPEYFITQTLTDKSDVYSMGVVLLEIVCGRKVIDKNNPEINLIQWVTSHLDGEGNLENLSSLIDKRLKSGDFSIKSVEIVTMLAIRCLRQKPSHRPNTNEIVLELKEALDVEGQSNLNGAEEISIDFSNVTDRSSFSLLQMGTTEGSSSKSLPLFSPFSPR